MREEMHWIIMDETKEALAVLKTPDSNNLYFTLMTEKEVIEVIREGTGCYDWRSKEITRAEFETYQEFGIKKIEAPWE